MGHTYKVHSTREVSIIQEVEVDDDDLDPADAADRAIELADENPIPDIGMCCDGVGKGWKRDETGEIVPRLVIDPDGTEVWSDVAVPDGDTFTVNPGTHAFDAVRVGNEEQARLFLASLTGSALADVRRVANILARLAGDVREDKGHNR